MKKNNNWRFRGFRKSPSLTAKTFEMVVKNWEGKGLVFSLRAEAFGVFRFLDGSCF